MAISMRLNTRRRTAVARATRLPRYARNDKVGTDEMLGVLARNPQATEYIRWMGLPYGNRRVCFHSRNRLQPHPSVVDAARQF